MVQSKEGRLSLKLDWMVVYKLPAKLVMLSIALRTGVSGTHTFSGSLVFYEDVPAIW